MTPTVSATAAVTRRRRRWLRWSLLLGLPLLALAVPLGVMEYNHWSDERELAEAIAETDRLDPRWRLDEILADRPAIADADNPALVVGKVDALLQPGVFDLGERNERLFEKENLSPANRLNDPQIVAVRVALEKHARALKLARTLKDFRGEGRFAIEYAPVHIQTPFAPLQRCRGVMQMLQLDAFLRAEEEDGAGALQSCRAVLVAARSIGNEPDLPVMLIRVAGQRMAVDALERVLAQSEKLPAAELKAMQELLAREIAAPILLHALRGERGGWDRSLANLQIGTITLAQFNGGKEANSWGDWLETSWLVRCRPQYLRLMNQAVEAVRQPVEKQSEAMKQFTSALEAMDRDPARRSPVLLIVPAVHKLANTNRCQQANLRSALVAVVVERYRLEHDAWPERLEDVVKAGLLDAAPLDPMNGQPLRYKRLADGVVVYSVGVDGADDGGRINRDNREDPGYDLGVRLWDVDRRRQNPLPPPIDEEGGRR
jgi:hypothetical protein